jgi:hypothetical protein
VESDVRTPSRRTNFLLRQVVIPSWVQVILMLAYVYALVTQLIENPLRLIAILAASVAFGALVLVPLRRRAGQPTPAEEDAEVKAAPSREVAVNTRWRQVRTYQVWHLIVLVPISVGVLLSAFGVPTP